MMLPTQFIKFTTIEHDLVEVATEDGIGHYPVMQVTFELGEETYVHPQMFLAKFAEQLSDDGQDTMDIFFNSRELCERFIARIHRRGSIDLAQWEILQEPEYVSLEQQWKDDFEVEQQERRQCGVIV